MPRFFIYFNKSRSDECDKFAFIIMFLGGARMKYPISYVFITEDDHVAAFTQHQTSLPGSFPSHVAHPVSKANHLFSSLLTPPMSPNDEYNMKEKNHKSFSRPSLKVSCDSLQTVSTSSCISSIKRSIAQECCTSLSSDKSDDSSASWDFQDPSAVFKCVCSR